MIMLKKYKSRHGARAPSGAKYHGRTGGQKVKMDLTRQWTYRCTSNNSNPILIDLMANVKLRMSRHRDQKTLNRSLQYILYASGFLALSSLLANHTSLSSPHLLNSHTSALGLLFKVSSSFEINVCPEPKTEKGCTQISLSILPLYGYMYIHPFSVFGSVVKYLYI